MKRYRMFPFWIGLGLGLASLVLVNSIMNYRQVSQRVILMQLRRDLATDVVTVDRQVRNGAVIDPGQVDVMLRQARQAGIGRIAWIQLRDGDGRVVARAGMAMPAAFQTDFIRAKLRERQPIFKTLDTSAGKVVVEAFPFRLPATLVPAGATGETEQVRQRRQFGVFEIAAFVDSAAASLWPLQRSLILNSSAALALFALIIVIGLRFRSYVAGRQIEQQLEIARGVQRDLLPTAERVSDNFEMAADCIPASRVGGDFYDAIPTEGNGAAFVLGDVSGKGIPAALLMGVMHGAIRSSSWTESSRRHEDATRQINRLLCERASGERYASMFWSYFDAETHMIRYINAGHFPPVLFRAKQPNNPVRLEEGGPVLGLLPYAMFEQGSVRLDPGDVLVLYSDGVVEAANAADDQFGEARLLEIVRNSLDRSAEEIRNRILAAVGTFTSHAAPDDDRTLLVIRYTGAAERRKSRTTELVGAAA